MIIATITALMILFGGSDTLEHYLLNIKKSAKAAIENKQTVKEVVSLSKTLEKDLEAENEEIIDLKKSFLDLHVKYSATQADFDSVLEEMLKSRKAGQDKILDTRFAMKDLMTKEEWDKVFASK